jgi:hypothetical protein
VSDERGDGRGGAIRGLGSDDGRQGALPPLPVAAPPPAHASFACLIVLPMVEQVVQ